VHLELAVERRVADPAVQRQDAVDLDLLDLAVAQRRDDAPAATGECLGDGPRAQLDCAGGTARELAGGGVECRTLRERVAGDGAPARRRAANRPDDARPRGTPGKGGELAGRGLGGVPGAGEQDRPAGPLRCLARDIGQRADDAILEGRLAGGGYASVAQSVRLP